MSNLTIGGVAVDPAASYRITVNSFLADGATSSPSCARAPTASDARSTRMPWRTYIAPSLTGAPVAPPALDRIDVVP